MAQGLEESGKNENELPQTVRRSFTRRYLSALCLVGVLSTSAFVILTTLLQSQTSDAVVINVAGRQRMLSQRVAKMALRMTFAEDDVQRERARELLEQSVALMRSSHQALLSGSDDLGIAPGLSPRLQDHYFGRTALSARVETYLNHAEELLAAPADTLTENGSHLAFMVSQAEKPLLKDLNTAVQIYENESKQRTQLLHDIEVGLWLTTLILLLVEGLFIFRPIVLRLAEQMRRIQSSAAQLREKDHRIGLLLEATRDGLLPIDQQGRITEGASPHLKEWFGVAPQGTPFWEYLSAAASRRRLPGHPNPETLKGLLELGFEQLADGFLPFEMCLDQMPSRVTVDGEPDSEAKGGEREERVFSLDYRQVLDGDERVGFLIVVREITAEIQREKAERAARELQGILSHLLRDRPGFVDFAQETEAQLVRYVRSAQNQDDSGPPALDPAERARLLHTIKGNTAIFGFHEFSARVHAAESAIEQGSDPKVCGEELRAAWQETTERLNEWLKIDDESLFGLWLSESEYRQHLRTLEKGHEPEKILPGVRRWQHEPVRRRMERLATAAQNVANRLNKEVTVEVEDPMMLRLPQDHFGPIWDGLVHIVRNAVDHGIERPDVRKEKGKTSCGHLTIGCRVLQNPAGRSGSATAPQGSLVPPSFEDGDVVEICVTDDGAGIDWESIAKKAAEHGLSHDDPQGLVSALFSDGVSTKEQVTEVSGRGVGLSALYSVVLDRKGEMKVESANDQGTTFTLRVPLAS